MMRIVAAYEISEEDIDLSQLNEPDVLESMGREDEPFENVEDVLCTVAEGLDSGNLEPDILTDDFNAVIEWTVWYKGE